MISDPTVFYKHCKKCDVWKLSDQFHNDAKRHRGKFPYCKDCVYSYMRDRYKNKPGVRDYHLAQQKLLRLTDDNYREKHRQYAQKHYNSIHGRAATLLKGAKRRSNNVSVSLERIIELLEIGVCPVTGLNFDMSAGIRQTGKTYNPLAPSIDQVIPQGGYTYENTRIVIWQYNLMKGELSDIELLHICRSIVSSSNEP